MAITKADVENVSFAIAKKGYDVDEVDVFLEKVADEIDLMNSTIADLRAKLNGQARHHNSEEVAAEAFEAHALDSEQDIEGLDEDARGIIAKKDEIIAQLRKDLDNKQADDSAISQALIVAQRSADEIIAKANTKADDTIQDAKDEADRIVNRAESEKETIMVAIAKLEEEREASRNGYANVLRDFIEDANTKLNNLGFDDDDQPIPYDDIENSLNEDTIAADPLSNVDLEKTAIVEPINIVEKDTSGFGDLSDDDDDLD